MGFKEKLKKSAREVSKQITENVIENKHLGNYTYETLSQELIALSQTKPMFRDPKWKKRFIIIEHEIRLKLSTTTDKFSKYQSMLQCMKAIGEMR